MGLDLKEGTLFAGRYQVVRALGMGAMGAVYEVVHLETERRRALKVLLPTLTSDPALWERFRREAKVGARVDSEFIVDVFDAGVDAETQLPFLVMELLRGEDLEKRLARQKRLPPAEVLTYLHQVALALDKTHAASIVHRDLKPENLFLTTRDDGQPRIKVLDFGIAKLIAGPAGARATQSLGTPLYMPPEQLNGETAVLSGAADIYALGMVAFTLLVGRAYWDFEGQRMPSLMALLSVVGRGPMQPACARAAVYGVELPPAFDAWFARATAPQPEQRFQVATEAVRGLASALGLSLQASSLMPPPIATGIGRDAGEVVRAGGGLEPRGLGAATDPLASPASTTSPPSRPRPRPRLGRGAAVGIALGVGVALGAGAYALHLGRAPARDGGEAAQEAEQDRPAPEPPPTAAATGAPAPVISAVEPAATAPASAEPAATASAAPSASSAEPRSTATPGGGSLRRRYTRD